MRSPAVALGSLLVAGLLVGCAGATPAQPQPASGSTEQPEDFAFVLPAPASLEQPRDVRFHVATASGKQLDLDWWTACLGVPQPGSEATSMLCADGFPPEDPPSVGSPDRVPLAFDLPGWTFREATFIAHDTDRSRRPAHEVRIRRTGERTFVIPAPPGAGDWDVDVFGRGPEGDAVTTFRWMVPGER